MAQSRDYLQSLMQVKVLDNKGSVSVTALGPKKGDGSSPRCWRNGATEEKPHPIASYSCNVIYSYVNCLTSWKEGFLLLDWCLDWTKSKLEKFLKNSTTRVHQQSGSASVIPFWIQEKYKCCFSYRLPSIWLFSIGSEPTYKGSTDLSLQTIRTKAIIYSPIQLQNKINCLPHKWLS